jgi:hypothetical protein
MSTWTRLLAALRREQQDVEEAVDEAVVRGNAAMDRRERELQATPEEKLAIEQERAAENDAELEAVRRRIEGRGDGDGAGN